MNDVTSATKTTISINDRQTASEAVIDAVADAKGVSTLDVRPPLYAVVDPDALDELVDSMVRLPNDAGGHVAFSYSGYDVTVSGDGDVSVAENGDEATSAFAEHR